MNKALFYSLMESRRLIRDSSVLMERFVDDDPAKPWRPSTADELKQDRAKYQADMDKLPQADKDKIAARTAEFNKKPDFLDTDHRRSGVQKLYRRFNIAARKVEKHGYKIGGKVAQHIDDIAKAGPVRTLTKAGAIGLPALIAGHLHGAYRTMNHPDVKVARSIGSAINKVKPYTPHMLALGGGLLAYKALQNDN